MRIKAKMSVRDLINYLMQVEGYNEEEAEWEAYRAVNSGFFFRREIQYEY